MKKYITLLTLFAVSAFSLVSFAQDDYKGKARIVVDEINKINDSLIVRMNISIDGSLTNKDESLILTPYLQPANGNTYIKLPEVVINGRKNHRLYRRTLTLDRTSYLKMSGKTVVGTDKATATNLYYRVSTPYLPWMDNSILNLEEELMGCLGEKT